MGRKLPYMLLLTAPYCVPREGQWRLSWVTVQESVLSLNPCVNNTKWQMKLILDYTVTAPCSQHIFVDIYPILYRV